MKKKLVSGILTGVFALAALIVGVYALIKVGMTFSGGIGFNPNGVYVELSGQVYRGKDFNNLEDIHDKPSYTYQKQTNYSETEIKKIEGWQAENVLFTPLYRHIQYRITVKNLSSEDISVIPSEITWKNGSSDNLNVIEEASATLRIPAGEERDYKLNFVLTDAAQDFTNKNWGITLNILKTTDIQTPADSYFSMSGTELQSLTSNGYSTSQFGNRVLRVPDSVGGAQVLSTQSNAYGNQVFKNLARETKYLILPKNLTVLGDGSFWGDNSYGGSCLNAVGMPEVLTSIGEHAFQNCYSLNELYLPKSLTTISSYAFQNCAAVHTVKLPEKITTISDYTFFICSSLMSIEIPSGITSIGEGAFQNCASIKSFAIPSGITSISDKVFLQCFSLSSVTIPNGVTSIGSFSFAYTALEEVEIPASVNSLTRNSFSGCSSSMITVDPANATYASEGGTLYNKAKTKLIKGAGKAVIDDIPSTVKSIEIEAFSGCTKLVSITIPSSINVIDENAFYGCTSLASIVIPSSVTTLTALAFQYCSSLKYIKMSGQTLSSAYTLPATDGKVWVTSPSASKPTDWTKNIVTTIPTSAGNIYYHQQAAWEK